MTGEHLKGPNDPLTVVKEVRCGEEYEGSRYPIGADCGCGGWGSQPCPSTTLVCECGEDGSWRDHHYELLAKTGKERPS